MGHPPIFLGSLILPATVGSLADRRYDKEDYREKAT